MLKNNLTYKRNPKRLCNVTFVYSPYNELIGYSVFNPYPTLIGGVPCYSFLYFTPTKEGAWFPGHSGQMEAIFEDAWVYYVTTYQTN